MPRAGSRQEPAYDMDRDGFTLLAHGVHCRQSSGFEKVKILIF
jgi:hypothetical protein